MKSRRQSKRRAEPPSRRRWLLPALGLVLLAITFALWRTQGVRPVVPTIPMRTLDATSAALVQQHLDAVRAAPRSGAAWGKLGAVLRAFEFKPEAEYCLTVATRLDPQEPRWPYLHGTLVALRSPLEAIPFLQRAVALCGNTPDAPRLRLASLLAENGRVEEARLELETLLRAVPDNAPALLTLAQLERARDENATALALTDRCLRDPRTARGAWTLRSILLQQTGNTNDAQAAAARAASLPPDLPVQDLFGNDAQQSRSDPRWLSDQAQRFLMTRQLTNAVPFVEQLLREHPGFAETWLVAGRLQLMQRRLEEAEASLSRHLALETNSVNGLFQLGLVLLEQDRLAEAATMFARAIKLKPDFGPAYFNLGVALGRSGQKPEAVASFREAIRHNPERIDSYILLADLLFDLGGRAQAQEVARQAEALNPTDRRLAQLWNKIGRP